jgi:hypothetical protein
MGGGLGHGSDYRTGTSRCNLFAARLVSGTTRSSQAIANDRERSQSPHRCDSVTGMRTITLMICLAIAVPSIAAASPDAAALAQTRVDAASKIYAVALVRWKSGAGSIDDVAAWSTRWLVATRELPSRSKKLRQALTDHRDRMNSLVATAAERVKAGAAAAIEHDEAAYFAVEAELWLARGK